MRRNNKLQLMACAVVLLTGADDATYETTPRSECGPISLHVCASLTGIDVRYETILSTVGEVSPRSGTSLSQLRQAADRLGMHSVAARWPDSVPNGLSAPAIVPITLPNGQRHFVAVDHFENDVALLIDIPHRPVWVTAADLRQKYKWDGTMLYLSRNVAAIRDVQEHLGWHWRFTIVGVASAVVVLAVSRLLGRWIPFGRKLR